MLVAPVILVPPNFHWYANVPLPAAATLNVAGVPSQETVAAGCVETDGATFTVNEAWSEVTDPHPPETATVYCPEFSVCADAIE